MILSFKDKYRFNMVLELKIVSLSSDIKFLKVRLRFSLFRSLMSSLSRVDGSMDTLR
jgi:hypothetical protein